jgi:hypothetical protein
VAGNVVSCLVKNGSDGDLYELLFSTGNTTQALSYQARMNLVITLTTDADNVLTSLDQVKRKLQVPLTDTSDDDLLHELIIGASTYFRTRCGRDFHLKTVTESLRPHDDDFDRLRLSDWPIIQISRIRLIDAFGTVWIDTSDTADFGFDDDGFVWWIRQDSWWEKFPGTNEVTYTCGYPKIPADIQQAVTKIVVLIYRELGKEGVTSERIGSYAYSRRGIGQPSSKNPFEVSDAYVEGIIRRYARYDLEPQ